MFLCLIVITATTSSARAQLLHVVPSYDGEVSAAMRVAIQGAVARWNAWIAEPATGEAASIEVKCNINHFLEPFASSAVEWYGLSSDYAVTPAQNMALNNADSNGSGVDANIGFNPDFLDPASFYYGTDGNTPGGKYDMMSLVLHEIGHVMGVDSSYEGYFPSAWGIFNPAGPSYHVTLWDSYLRDDAGNTPRPWTEPNPFNATGDVTFVGAEVQRVVGRPMGIYSPPTYEAGSSLVHVDDVAGSPRLMNYSAASVYGSAVHGLWDYEVAMFQDMGWHFTTILSDNALTGRLSGADGYWHNGSIWVSGLPPTGATDVVLGTAASPYTVYITRRADAGSVNVCGGATLLINEHVGLIGDLTVQEDLTVDGTIEMRQGALHVGNQTSVGVSGTGNFAQTGGMNTVSGYLYLGYSSGARGTYELSDTGTLWAGFEAVGAFGAGNFRQTGGTNTVGTYLEVALHSGSAGSYELSGTGTVTAPSEVVGVTGHGMFSQVGGTNTIGEDLTLGYFAGSVGAYELSGTGTLLASRELVGESGTGIFRQTGGQNGVNDLRIGSASGSAGTYELSGPGTLSASYEYVGYFGTGTFRQTGGANTVDDLHLGHFPGSAGTYELSGTGTLSAHCEDVGGGGAGTFRQTGGTNAISGGLLFLAGPSGSAGTYELSGTGTLSAWYEYVGNFGSGTFRHTGGTNTVSSDLYLARWSGSAGTYELSGPGALSASYEYVGNYGSGTFRHTGGTNTVNSDLYIGRWSGSAGTYELSGTGTLSARHECVGYSGTGSFRHTGGNNTIGGHLSVGNSAGSAGTYELSGTGILSACYELVGYYGTGTFVQTGGTNSVAGPGWEANVFLGYASGSTGRYELSGTGALSARHECVGYSGSGIFSQTGGTNGISGYLSVGDSPGSAGTYELSGTGTLSAFWEYVGYYGTGTFVQTGGTNTVASAGFNADFMLGHSSGSAGTYELSGTGTLSAFREYVGYFGTGTFRQTGGTNTLLRFA